MRKKASFTALLYRELLLCRKVLITYLITSLIFLLIPVLVILSLRFGNLTMLPEFIVADLRANNDLILVLCAVISPCMLVMSLSESSVFDAQIKWDRFRRSTPVKPAQMALAKYVLFLILLPISTRVVHSYAQHIEKQKQFITNAGHEIKTPVAIMLSNLDAMELIQGENKWSRNIRSQTDRLSVFCSVYCSVNPDYSIL